MSRLKGGRDNEINKRNERKEEFYEKFQVDKKY